MDTQAALSADLSSSRRDSLILICTSVPSFMLQLDANVVSVSLPAISRTLHAGFSGIEWVITAYMLSFAALLMPAGALADRFGRKRVLVFGLSLFTVASVFCGLASSLSGLIVARAIQGAGAAMQLSSALATLSHTFQGKARARAFSFWGSVVGIGMAAGPVVGGLITQTFGWQWAFYVNLPVGVTLVALIACTLESSRDPKATQLDLPGVLTFSSALFLATLALIEVNERGWNDVRILRELICAALLFGVFIIVEQRQTRPMLDLSYFRKPTYLGATIAQFAFSVGMLTMLTFVPVYLQSRLGTGAAAAGLMMLPMVLPLFIVPRVVSRYLAHRLSGRTLLSAGLLLVAVGLLSFTIVARMLAYAPMLVGMLTLGVGAGLLNGETTKVGMSVIPKERAGMASGVSGTVRFTGLVLGIAVLGAVLYARINNLVSHTLPRIGAADRSYLIQNIAAGRFANAMHPQYDPVTMHTIAVSSFASGYQVLFLVAALFMIACSALTWRLVNPLETPPVNIS
ncbi:MFS transporter [Paraburkholderia caribensis]|uniref:MFS transporter n=1 Tax=Paraburkholderia caribensis TaxID=75105 RepID=UPI0034D2B710